MGALSLPSLKEGVSVPSPLKSRCLRNTSDSNYYYVLLRSLFTLDSQSSSSRSKWGMYLSEDPFLVLSRGSFEGRDLRHVGDVLLCVRTWTNDTSKRILIERRVVRSFKEDLGVLGHVSISILVEEYELWYLSQGPETQVFGEISVPRVKLRPKLSF